ncbi:MAG: HYR domain-containing protein [Flavobacteriales bacterium]
MSRRHLLISLMLLLAAVSGSAQSLTQTWLNQTDQNGDDFAQCIATDTLNNFIYVAGSANNLSAAMFSSFVFAAGGSSSISASGGLDGYLAKMNMNGQVLWAVSIAGVGDDQVLDLSVGQDGNIYAVGYYSSDVSFNTMSGSVQAFADDGGGALTTDAFMVCYNTAGALLWARREYSSNNEKYFGVTALCDGVAAIGTYESDPDAMIQEVNIPESNYDEDVFITKYMYDGSAQWLIAGGSEEEDYDHNLLPQDSHYAITSYNDSLYFIASFEGLQFGIDYSTNYAAGNALYTASSPEVDSDYVLGSITSDGKINWIRRQLHNGDIAKGMGIAADCSGVYATALAGTSLTWEGTGTTAAATNGNQDIFIARYNKSSGAGIWYKMLSSVSLNELERPSSLVADKLGNIYLAGTSANVATLDGNIITVDVAGASFILVLDKNGNYQIHTTTNTLSEDRATDLAICKGNEIVYCGWSAGNLDANQGVTNFSADSYLCYMNNTPEMLHYCCTTTLIACPLVVNLTATGCSAAMPDFVSSIVPEACACISYKQSPAANALLGVGIHSITIYANSTVLCSGTVVVSENISPVLINPGNQLLSLGNNCTATLPDYRSLFAPSDNCTADSSLVVIQNPVPGSAVSGMGTIHVSLTATDASGNSTTTWIAVVPVPTTNPQLSGCQTDISANTGSGGSAECAAGISYNVPNVNPACGNCYNGNSIPGYTYLGTFNNHKYFRSNGMATWSVADSLAYNLGGHLATLRTVQENNFIDANTSEILWTGLTDVANEGVWKLTNGESTAITNWAAGEPFTAGSNYDYAVINTAGGGQWSADLPFALHRYIVEFDCPTLLLTSGLSSGSDFPEGNTTVTYTASDEYGNSSSCSFTITVTDNDDPDITCPSNLTVSASPFSCNALVNVPATLATDNCAVTKLTWTMTGATVDTSATSGINQIGNYTFNAGTTYISFIASDAAGNTENCSFSVKVNDTTPPIISCNGVLVLTTSISSCSKSVSTVNPTYSDNCGVAKLTWTLSGATTSASVNTGVNLLGTYTFNSGITTVTYTATDAAGNSNSCSYSITINDNISPTLVCAGNISVNSASGSCSASVAIPNIAYTDNCGVTKLTWTSAGATIAQSNTTGINQPGTQIFNTGQTQVTMTATDAVGNSNACTFTVTVNDTTPPVISCPANLIVNCETGTCGAVVSYAMPGASDNCALCNAPGSIAGFSFIGTHNGHKYYKSLLSTTWANANALAQAQGAHLATVSSAAENMFLSTAGITWLGYADCITEALFVSTNGEAFGYNNWAAGQPDNATNDDYVRMNALGAGKWDDQPLATSSQFIIEFDCPSITMVSGIASGQTFPVGLTNVSYQASDVYGNTSSCSFSVTVTDTEAPIAVSCLSDQTLYLDENCKVLLPDYRALASFTDNCNAVLTLNQYPAPGTILRWNTLIFIEAVDDAGLNTFCTFNAIVLDATPPTINNCPGDMDLSNEPDMCGAYFNTNIISADNCSCTTGLMPGYTLIGTQGGHTYYKSNGNHTWNVAYNMALATGGHLATLTTAAENAFMPTNSRYWIGLTDAAQEGNYQWITGEPFAYNSWLAGQPDNTGNEDFVCTNQIQAGMWSDKSGTELHPFLLEFECLGGITILTIDAVNISLIDIVELDDVVLTDYYDVGQHQLEFAATDLSGNSDTCSFSINVIDVQSPQLTCTANISYYSDDLNANATDPCMWWVDVPTPIATDNCVVDSIYNGYNGTNDASAYYPIGTTSVVWKALDAAGNLDSCIVFLSITDNTPPVVQCEAYVQGYNLPGLCEGTAIVPLAVVTNECGISTISNDYNGTSNASDVYPHWQTLVTFTATDESGNTGTCTTLVDILDVENPIIVCPAADTLTMDDNCNAYLPDYLSTLSIYDNCNEPFAYVYQSPGAGSITYDGDIVTIEAMDAHGNDTICSFPVYLIDDIAPQIVCAGNISASVALAMTTVYINVPNPVITENCNYTLSILVDALPQPAASGNYTIGTHNVLWTVTDDSGNVATCNTSIVVHSNEFPVIDCPENFSASASASTCGKYVSIVVPSVTDDQAVPINAIHNSTYGTSANDASGIYPVGSHTITWSATDIDGNTSTCSHIITITDNELPLITCSSNLIRNANAGTCGRNISSITPPAYSDNCSGATLQASVNGVSGLPTFFPVGTTVITWQVSDAAGNTVSCTQSVVVIDNQDPIIACPVDISANANAGTCVASLSILKPVYSDNCSGVVLTHDSPYLPANPNGLGFFNGNFPIGTHTIEWIATDAANHTANCLQTVFISDNQFPNINCSGNQNIAVTDNCDPSVVVSIPFVNDNCGIASLINDYTGTSNASSTYPVGTTNVLWTVTDVNNNTNNCSVNITVSDVTPPELVCASDTTVFTIGSCEASVSLTTPQADDVCGIASLVCNHPSLLFPIGTTLVQWTATDVHGNTSSCLQQVIVLDAEAPSIICPQDTTYITDWNTCMSEHLIVSPTVGDNCSVSTLTCSIADTVNLYAFDIGITQVEWIVTDVSGNYAACTQNINVMDVQVPELTCADTIHAVTSPSACDAWVTMPTAVATDNCAMSMVWNEVNNTNDASGTYALGNTQVIWHAEDVAGNTSTCISIVSVKDIAPPSLVCVDELNIYLDDNCNAYISDYTGSLGVTDNCDAMPVTTQWPMNVLWSGEPMIQFTASDAWGNLNICNVPLQVWDTIRPVVSNCPQDVFRNFDSNCSYIVPDFISELGIAFADNCSATLSVQQNPPVGSLLFDEENTVYITASDAEGNMQSCTFNLNLSDNESPEIICSDDFNIVADANCTALLPDYKDFVITNDNCGVTDILQSPAPGFLIDDDTEVTLIAYDEAGNTDSCTFTVELEFLQPPSIVCPLDISISVDSALCGANVNPGMPVVSEVCGAFTISASMFDATMGSGFYDVGIQTLIWMVVDENGNSSSCQQIIQVKDLEAPLFDCLSNIQVPISINCTYSIPDLTQLINATDNCAVQSIVQSPVPTTIANGNQWVDIMVSDYNGNYTACQVLLQPVDTIAPLVLQCADTLYRSVGIGCEYVMEDFTTLVQATDNCNVNMTVVQSNTGDIYQLADSPVQVLFNISDLAGNLSQCSAVVVLVDDTSPVLSCPQNVSVSTDTIQNFATMNIANPVANDNCSLTLLTWSLSGATVATSGTTGINFIGSHVFNLGTTVVQYIATDAVGNMNNCSFTVDVIDTEIPLIDCVNSIEQSTDESLCTAWIDVASPVISDNDGVASLTNDFNGTSEASGNYIQGTTQVIWTVTDNAGNQNTCTTQVVVTDLELPQITCTSNLLAQADADQCGLSLILQIPVATDNCSVVNVASDHPSSFYDVGTTLVTWTATDGSGNVDTCQQLVEVADTQDPIAICSGNMEVSTTDGLCSALVQVPAPIYDDNCAVLSKVNSFNNTNDASGNYPIGTTTVWWTVTDVNGNTSQCSQNVTVTDGELPQIVCPDDAEAYITTGCQAWLDFDAPVVDDNCSSPSFTHNYQAAISNINSSAFYPLGTTQVVWTVTDAANNTNTCIQTIMVYDVADPVMPCPEDILVYTDGSEDSLYLNIPVFAPTDNCSVINFYNNYTGTWNASANYPVGSTLLEWYADDASGNSVVCEQQIIVMDTLTASTLCNSYYAENDDQLCGALVQTALPLVESSGSYTMMNDYNNTSLPISAFFDVGTHYIQWTVTEWDGGISTCIDTVTVADVQVPQVLCTDSVFVFAEQGMCGANVIIDQPVVIENCGYGLINTYNGFEVASDFYPMGATTLQWIAIDTYGGFGNCIQVVVVQANTYEPMQCPGDQQLQPGTEGVFNLPDYTTMVDYGADCPYSITQWPEANVELQGNVQVTLFAMIQSELVDSCTFTVLIDLSDSITFNCPDLDITLGLNSMCEAVIGDYSALIDSSQIQSLSAYTIHQLPAVGNVWNGEQQVLMWISNVLGQSSDTCAIDLITADTTAPWLQQVGDTTIYLSGGFCETMFFTNFADAFDNCDAGVQIGIVNDPGVWFTAGQYQMGYFAIDDAGNTSDTLYYNLSVVDNNANWFVPLDTNYYETCDINFIYPQVYVTNCAQQLIPAVDISTALQPGVNTITFVSGAPGSENYYTYTVEVSVPPVIEWVVADEICVMNATMSVAATTDAMYEIIISGIGVNQVLVNHQLIPSDFGAGTYTLILDVLSDICFNDLTQEINILPAPSINFGDDEIDVCALTAYTTISAQAGQWSWTSSPGISFVQTGNMIEITADTYGDFELTAMMGSDACTAMDTLIIHYWQPPLTPDAGPDQTVHIVSEVLLSANNFGEQATGWIVAEGSGIFQDEWSLNTTVSELTLGENQFVITNLNGACSASDTVTITLYGLQIPNGYSPNADGVNDGFEIPGIENLEMAALSVYNRWGQLVYENNKYQNEWQAQNKEGEQLPDDTYFYELILSGETHHGFVVIKR